MPRPQPYLAQLLGLTALLLAAIAGLNYAVDPFGIYDAPVVAGRTAHKPGLHNRDRMVKAYAIARLRPDALLLGTSRVQFGIDPDHPALRARAARPYNAGLVNADWHMVLRYLQHAQAVAPLRLALIGIDPLMFDAAATTGPRDFTDQRLAAAPDGSPQAPLTSGDVPLTLLSSTALRLSVETLRHQADIRTDLLPSGQRNQEVLAAFSRANGTLGENIALIERDYVAELAAAELTGADGHAAMLQPLRAVLDFARAHGIALHLFFTPGHVRMLEVMRATGRLDAADQVKRDVVALVGAEAAAAGAAPFALWDFSLPGPITTEAVPTAPDAAMRHYWETSHFRPAVGALLLTRMLAPVDAAEQEAATDFGIRLAPDTLAAALAAERRDLAAWEQAHGDAVAQIAGYAAADAATRARRAAARRAHGGRP